MRQLVLFLACVAILAATAADAGRRRGNAEPVIVYFPPDPTVDPNETYDVQIPMEGDWTTVLTVAQGSCLRYDAKLSGRTPPHWIRMCWTSEPTLCSEPAVECDPNDPAWASRGVAPEDVCTERMCQGIR